MHLGPLCLTPPFSAGLGRVRVEDDLLAPLVTPGGPPPRPVIPFRRSTKGGYRHQSHSSFSHDFRSDIGIGRTKGGLRQTKQKTEGGKETGDPHKTKEKNCENK